MSPKPPELIDHANWWSRTAPIETTSFVRRAAIVKKLKRILPIGGVVMLALVLIWPVVKPALPEIDWSGEIQGTGAELAMLNLTYRGTNDKGEPFIVTADKATRNVPLGMEKESKLAPVIGLTVPKATLQNADGTTTDIAAQTGQYDETAQGLVLDGDVKIVNSRGMTLDAPQLSVDFKSNRAWTDKPVTATGDFGVINGEGMQLENGGKTIIFTGQSKAILNGKKPMDAQDTPQDASQPQPNQP